MRSSQRNTFFKDIYERPFARTSSSIFAQHAKDNVDLVQRFGLLRKLPVHDGCVNTLSWNNTGEYILSGSDDQRLVITNGHNYKKMVEYQTGHHANIFSAKFLPCTNDKQIVSCSGDGIIIYTDLERQKETYKNEFTCHTGTTYEVITIPNEPHTFLSCGEDGNVRFFDLRVKTSCLKPKCKEDILVNEKNAITALAISPVTPHHLAIGCSDSFVKIYDRRYLTTDSDTRCVPFCTFVAPEMEDRIFRITSLSYSADAEDMLVSYSCEHLYLFGTRDENGGELKKCRPLSKLHGKRERKSPLPPRRLRLRGDWSDTGPDARPESETNSSVSIVSQARPHLNGTLMQRMTSVLSRMLNDPMTRAALSAGGEDSLDPVTANSTNNQEQQPQQQPQASTTNQEEQQQATSSTTNPNCIVCQEQAAAAATEEGATSDNNLASSSSAANPAAPTSDINISQENANTTVLPASSSTSLSATTSSSTETSNNLNLNTNTNERMQVDDDVDLEDSRESHEDSENDNENNAGAASSSVAGEEGEGGNRSEEQAKRDSVDLSGINTSVVTRHLRERLSVLRTLRRGFIEQHGAEPSVSFHYSDQSTSNSTISLRTNPNEQPSTSTTAQQDMQLQQQQQGASSEGATTSNDADGFDGQRPESDVELDYESDEASSMAIDAECAAEDMEQYVFEATQKKKYIGHRNARTMIKEATFWGNEFVMSGSDCGHIFIWDRNTTDLKMLLQADNHVVNCLQPHPTMPLLATSGIDHDIKLWAPILDEPSFDREHAENLITRNAIMLEETRDTITVPASFMIRMLACLNQIRQGTRSRMRTSSDE